MSLKRLIMRTYEHMYPTWKKSQPGRASSRNTRSRKISVPSIALDSCDWLVIEVELNFGQIRAGLELRSFCHWPSPTWLWGLVEPLPAERRLMGEGQVKHVMHHMVWACIVVICNWCLKWGILKNEIHDITEIRTQDRSHILKQDEMPWLGDVKIFKHTWDLLEPTHGE